MGVSENTTHDYTLIFVRFIIVVIAGLIITKLFFVQVIHGREYAVKADRQYSAPVSDIFDRGAIFFTRKDGTLVSAATQTSGFKVAIEPKKIIDAGIAYDSVSAITPLNIDRDTFIQKAAHPTDPYEEVANHLTKETADALSALGIKGVSIYKEKWRFYPGNELASQLIGFVGFQGDTRSGRYGLERYYDDVLQRTGAIGGINFFAELFGTIERVVLSPEHMQGDVITSIEPLVEQHLEKTLAKIIDTWHSDEAGGIIMDPKTGEIFAIGAIPSFDPNTFQETKNIAQFSNPLVEHVFELGSIIKPLTVASGLDAGVITPDTTYTDTGHIVINKRKISNFDGKARGVVSIQTVLDKSLNTGAVFVQQKVGDERLRNYFYNFGLNTKTNIDLPNEVTNLTRNLESSRDVDYATASFGQGIALTPVSAIRAFASLANGGTLVTPHVVRSIVYKDGGSKTIELPVSNPIFNPKTSETITRMLVHVFDNGTANGKLKFEHYSVAAKTGTAQLVKPTGGYYDDKFLHTMFGYFPAYDPRFIVFLYNHDPQGVTFAADTLGGVFRDTVQFLIDYYDVAPDR